MSAPIAGVCRHCGCSEANARTLSNGDPCCWVNSVAAEPFTVCSNPSCITAEMARLRRLATEAGVEAARPRPERSQGFRGCGHCAACNGRTRGICHQVLAARARHRARRRKGRAA